MDRRLSVDLQRKQQERKTKNKKRRKSVGDVSTTQLSTNRDAANTATTAPTSVVTSSIGSSGNSNTATTTATATTATTAATTSRISGIDPPQRVRTQINVRTQNKVIRELFKANNDPAILKASKVKRSKLEQKMKKIMGKLDANRYNSLDKLIETVWFRMSNDDIQYLTPTEAISQETKRRKAEKERREAIADVAVRKISEAKQEVKANRANITTFLAQNGGDAYLNKLVTDSLGTTTDIYGLADGLKQALINGQTLVNDMLLREYIAIAANEITTNSTLYTDETLDAETGEPNKQILLNSLTQYLVENADGIEKATEEREEYQTAAELTLQEVEMMIDENRLKGLSDGATLGIIKSLSEHYGSIEPDQVAPADEMTVTETHLTMMGDTPPLQRQITSLNIHLPVDQMIAKE
jgi:hypothetical protein